LAKKGCALIYSPSLSQPNLSFGFNVNRPFRRERASGDKFYGIGTLLVVMFFMI